MITNNSSQATAVNIYSEETFPTLTNCIVFNSGKHGAFVGEGASAHFTDCEIRNTGNALLMVSKLLSAHSGVHVISGGVATIEDCQIHDSKQHGVFINREGTAHIRRCHIFDIAGKGWHIETESPNSTFVDNNVHDCRGADVGGTTSAQDCTIM